MKICAGIVLYNPDIHKLSANIRAIRDQVDALLLVDNGSGNAAAIDELLSGETKPYVMLRNAENKGIAAALNQLCAYALAHGYDWCLTLDQDSVCPADLITALCSASGDKAAIVAPNIVYRDNEQFAQHKQGIEEVSWVITSASLTNLCIWQEIGGFDEKLFIDSVDRDYCERARRAGYVILRHNGAELMHELGNLKCLRFGPVVINVTNHSAFRRYYMTRNMLYLDRKFGQHKAVKTIAKNTMKVLLFEDHKADKLKATLRGIRDAAHL